MSATILPFRPARPSTTITDAPVRLADRLLEAALALRIAARRQRPAPEPRRLEIGEKVLFHWPNGERNRETFPDAQTHPGLRSAHERRRAVALAAPDGAGNLKLTTGVIVVRTFGAACEADRRYIIQITEGPDRGTRICHPRKGLITVFKPEQTGPQGRKRDTRSKPGTGRAPGTFARTDFADAKEDQ